MKGIVALSAGWHAALSEAWEAYCAGSYPIGACIVQAGGKVMARGRNRICEEKLVHGVISGCRQAHAEMNAILTLPDLTPEETAALTIYTTVEPCPMCLGAIRMQKIPHLAFAAADLWAGHTHALGERSHLDRRRLTVSRAPAAVIRACEVWQIAFQLEKGMPPGHGFFEVHRAADPLTFGKGQQLFQAGVLPALRERRAPLGEVLGVLS